VVKAPGLPPAPLPPPAPRLQVAIEDIRFDGPPGTYYEIYLNLPGPNDATGPRSPYFAGTISFFALQHNQEGGHPMPAAGQGKTAIVDVTDAVNRLRALGKLGEDLKVTIRQPVTRFKARGPVLGAPPKQVAPRAAAPKVTIGAVRLQLTEP
jgi:hypothetical protein